MPPGDVGLVAGLLDTIAKWSFSEDGYAEWSKRRQLASLNKQAKAQLAKRDFTSLRATVAELKRLSERP